MDNQNNKNNKNNRKNCKSSSYKAGAFAGFLFHMYFLCMLSFNDSLSPINTVINTNRVSSSLTIPHCFFLLMIT